MHKLLPHDDPFVPDYAPSVPDDALEASDEDLVTLFVAGGDAGVLGRLYTRHLRLVYGLCLKYLGSKADAEDAAMEIFEELVDKLPAHRVRNFKTWLWSVARNHCLQRLRREKRVARVDFDDRFMESPPLLHLLNESSTDEAALVALQRCMGKLPERQREAVIMFFMERRSYAEIAEATLGDLKGVKSYIQNGKRNLRICLEKNGVRL
jgi:RNA polymerase sigma-70 factor (ECF subfamily)